MKSILDVLAGIVGTILSFFQQAPAPVSPVAPAPTPVNPKPKPDNHATLLQLEESEELNLGPMPGTGGVIHVDAPAMSDEIATLIIKFCGKYTLGLATVRERIALMTAWIDAESRFDPKADDPNDQSLPKNATALQILQNSDLGIAQFSYRTLAEMPDFKGMSPDQIATQAFDPEWAIEAMFQFCESLLSQARAAMIADPVLKREVPNGDPLVLGIESYNIGPNGSVAMARNDGLKGNWKYAQSVIAKRDKWLPLFV